MKTAPDRASLKRISGPPQIEAHLPFAGQVLHLSDQLLASPAALIASIWASDFSSTISNGLSANSSNQA